MHPRLTDHPFTAGRILAGRFRIVRQLGFGGMGAVFEVEHQLTRHRRALKLLHPHMTEMPAVVERFLREASAAGRIGNAHIVETFDAGRLETGEPYIVMELLQGRTLAEVLHQVGPLDIARTCDLMSQACDGVGAAHAAGIVHRDLKPENLFLASPNESFVKLLDFGISKFDAAITGVEGLTLEGSPMGTPYYMSPEQVSGQGTVDARTDVYALGVVLYECLTARRPFNAESLPQLVLQIAQGRYLRPTEVRPDLPPAADAIVQKAMAMDPLQRFSSTDEFSLALQSLLLSPERTVVLQSAPPVTLPLPATESAYLQNAMTPGVFSRSSVPQIAKSEPRVKRGRTWLYLATALLGIVALGFGVWVNRKGNPSPTASGAALPPHASSAVRDQLQLPNVVNPLSREASSISAQAPLTPPASTSPLSSLRQPISQNTQPLPSTSVSRARSAHSKPASSTSLPTSRAASQGLAQDNPFK